MPTREQSCDQPTACSRPGRLTFATAATLLSAGCQGSLPVIRDYCGTQQRTLSREERLRGALIHVLPNARRRGLAAYADLADRMRQERPVVAPSTIAAAYPRSTPDCCTIDRPWPIASQSTNPFTRNQGYEDEYRAVTRRFSWVYDVRIAPRPGAAGSIFYVELVTDQCGRFREADHG